MVDLNLPKGHWNVFKRQAQSHARDSSGNQNRDIINTCYSFNINLPKSAFKFLVF